MTLSLKHILLIALAVASLNAAPYLLLEPGGDIFLHYTMLDCFAHQFWQGDLYPRWCMEANVGLGTPALLLYYPLSYYISAIFIYPLHIFGADIKTILLLSFWLASVVSFITCFLWLKDIASPKRALLIALAYLFLPYRMKLMFYSSGIAEVWALAITPLLFLYTRRLIQGDKKSWLPLATFMTVGVFTHVSATFFALLACGLQMLFSKGEKFRPLIIFAGGGLIAILASGCYWLPAMHFRPFFHPDALAELRSVSANRYLTLYDLSHGYARSGVSFSLALLLALGLGLVCLIGRKRLPDFIRRETSIWILITLLGGVLTCSLSAPLWDRFDYVMMGLLPWRAQALPMYAAAYFFAVKAQFLMTEKQLKTWKGDYVALMLVIILSGLLLMTSLSEMTPDYFRKVEGAHIVGAGAYRTEWTDKERIGFNYLMAIQDEKLAGKRPEHEAGGCAIKEWDFRAIALDCARKKAGELKIEHYYFPIWKANVNGWEAPLSGEEHSGYMLLALPAGESHVRLTPDIRAEIGAPYDLAKACSLLTLALLAGFWGRRLFRQ